MTHLGLENAAVESQGGAIAVDKLRRHRWPSSQFRKRIRPHEAGIRNFRLVDNFLEKGAIPRYRLNPNCQVQDSDRL
ncbi:MAG: hypothetical protein MJA27_16505 [Pseudanabaenales cyanobacterium]|nr:hypothetical protein [Pseudanabaenales cyanobacterium]